MIPTPPSFSSLTDISQPSKRPAADDRDNYRSKPNTEEGCPMATMIIEGDRTKAASGETYEIRNPATGEVVDEVPAGGPADVDRAAQAAAKAFGTWSKLPSNQRREILHKAAQHMLSKVDEIATVLTKEQGKTLLESRLEARRFGENIGWFADLADKVHGQYVRLPDLTTYGLVVRKPIGVCGAIVPWNFPLTLAANKVAPAIAAGNTVVLKPASTTPLSTLACIEALIEGGLPEGVVNVVLGQATGDAIVAHPIIRKVALTGSTPTGKKVMARAAEQLKKITLELGGSDACNVPDGARMWTEEVFGPALPVRRIKDLDEGLQLANDSQYGLGSSVWTTNMAAAYRAVQEIEAGYTWVNALQIAHDELPFGGTKQSGFGKEHGVEAYLHYTEEKSVVYGGI